MTGAVPGTHVILRPIKGLTNKEVLPAAFSFQVPPIGDITQTIAGSHGENETVGRVQVSRFSSASLRTATFPSLVIDDAPWWSYYDEIPDIHALIAQLRAVVRQGEIFQLVVTNRSLYDTPDINWPATLRSLEITERPGEPDVRYLSFSFSEFADAEIGTKKYAAPGNSKSRTPATLKTKTLPPGRRTMHAIAKFYYGSAEKWRHLVKANAWLGKVSPSKDLRTYAKAHPSIRVPKPN